jgi:hypothetical protein
VDVSDESGVSVARGSGVSVGSGVGVGNRVAGNGSWLATGLEGLAQPTSSRSKTNRVPVHKKTVVRFLMGFEFLQNIGVERHTWIVCQNLLSGT